MWQTKGRPLSLHTVRSLARVFSGGCRADYLPSDPVGMLRGSPGCFFSPSGRPCGRAGGRGGFPTSSGYSPTRDFQWGVGCDSIGQEGLYHICHEGEESPKHYLWSCTRAQEVWRWAFGILTRAAPELGLLTWGAFCWCSTAPRYHQMFEARPQDPVFLITQGIWVLLRASHIIWQRQTQDLR